MESVLGRDLEGSISRWWHDPMVERSAEFQAAMHKVMLHFFSESKRNFEAVLVFISCASFKAEPKNNYENSRFAASELSPLLAASKYFIQCIMVNDVYVYQESVTKGWKFYNKISQKK